MKLDDAQKQQVSRWLDQGLKLSEIQSRLASELGVRLTYMEVRFLIDDLKLKPKDPEPEKPAKPATSSMAAGQKQGTGTPDELEDELEEETAPDGETPSGNANVSVTVDQLARPGAVVSGRVRFSDGKSAEWHLDQFGRLGVAPQEQGYKPSQSDLMEFQRGLQRELAKMGF